MAHSAATVVLSVRLSSARKVITWLPSTLFYCSDDVLHSYVNKGWFVKVWRLFVAVSKKKRNYLFCFATLQFHTRFVLTDGLQINPLGLRLGTEQQGHWEQSQGIPPIPLRESADVVVWSFPWFLHGACSRILELQLHGWVRLGARAFLVRLYGCHCALTRACNCYIQTKTKLIGKGYKRC